MLPLWGRLENGARNPTCNERDSKPVVFCTSLIIPSQRARNLCIKQTSICSANLLYYLLLLHQYHAAISAAAPAPTPASPPHARLDVSNQLGHPPSHPLPHPLPSSLSLSRPRRCASLPHVQRSLHPAEATSHKKGRSTSGSHPTWPTLLLSLPFQRPRKIVPSFLHCLPFILSALSTNSDCNITLRISIDPTAAHSGVFYG